MNAHFEGKRNEAINFETTNESHDSVLLRDREGRCGTRIAEKGGTVPTFVAVRWN